MTPEEYWAYKAFTRDDVTEESLRSSEVFMAYREAEMTREAKLNQINKDIQEKEKQDALAAFEEFEKKVAASPALKAKLRQVKDYLDSNPEAVSKTDPNFINGINMLDLED